MTTGNARAGLLALAGEAAEVSGDPTRAVTIFEQAVESYRASGEVLEANRATARIVSNLAGARRYSEAIERAQTALDKTADLDDSVRSDLARELSMARVQIGQPEEALAWIETALSLAERLDDATALARAVGAKGMILYNLGRHREAVILARGAGALADSIGDVKEQMGARLALSVYSLEDDPREAMEASRSSAELARRAGVRAPETTNLLNWAESAVFLGDRAATAQALRQASQRELNPEHSVWRDCIEAVLAALEGDAARAHSLVASHAAVASSEYIHMQATYLGTKSFVALLGGDLDEAVATARLALAADPMGINAAKCAVIQGRSCLWSQDVAGAREAHSALVGFPGRWTAAARTTLEAGIAMLEGRPEHGLERYRAAFEAWRALDSDFDLAFAALDLVLLDPEGAHDAEAATAREILRRLDIAPLLERLQGEVAVTVD